MGFLALALAAAAGSTQGFVREDLLRAQVLADVSLPAEKQISPGRLFFTQEVTRDGDLEFPDREEEKAARRKYDMDMSDYFALTEWIGILQNGELQHRGWLFCVRRSQFGTEKCLHDANDDGKFDHLTNLDPDKPDRFLKFEAIPDLAYRYVPRERKTGYRGMWRQPEVSLSYTFKDDQLIFGALAYLGNTAWSDLGLAVPVSIGSLPAAVEIAGVQVRVLSWDGRRARLAVTAPMSAAPVRFIAPDDRPIIGKLKGWRMEFSSAKPPRN